MCSWNIIACGLAVLLLAACAAPLPTAQKAVAEESAARKIECRKGHDCVDKWHKAIKWVNANSTFKIENTSDDLIKTAGPSGNGWWSYTIVRTARSKRRYVITLTPACGSMFGCEPDELAVRVSFADAILGPIPPKNVTPHAYGSIKQLQAQIQAAMDKCETERQSGELRDYRASVECSDPQILKIFKNASYPYMDMARELATKRMKLARLADGRQITPDDMQIRVKDEIASIEKRERQRNAVPPSSASAPAAPAPVVPAPPMTLPAAPLARH